MEQVVQSLRHSLPELVLTAGLLLVVLVDASLARWRDRVIRLLTLLTLALAFVACGSLVGVSGEAWSGMLVVDPLGLFFTRLLIAASLLVALIFTFRNSKELTGLGQGEFHSLLLGLTLSNVLLAGANDLAMIYLALEMVSITSYVMVAYLKGDRLSNEASLKYVLFGAVSTGAMLYGLSLLYGMVGSTRLPDVRAFAADVPPEARIAVYVVSLLVFAGFAFKVAAVPFHFWCPDVYQGAATPVTALLSVAPKAAGFAVMLRFFYSGLSSPLDGPWELVSSVDWGAQLMLVSVATMTLGNVAALTQTNMKRLLAYSSIAHAGYIMMGLVALSRDGARGMMVYLLAYLVMNLGAFFVVTLIHAHDGTFDLRDYPGLYRRAPLLTAAMAVFLLSLIGIPPFVGFMGKLYVFAAVIAQGSPEAPRFWWFAAAGAVNAAIAAFYYARVLKTMIIDTGNEDKEPLELPATDLAWVAALAAANLLPLLFWSTIEGWTAGSLSLYARL